MRLSLIVVVLLLWSAGAAAQTDQYIISRQGSVTILPVYQSWTAKDVDTKFSQVSGTLSVYVPLGRSFSFSLQGGGAASGGDVEPLRGLTDLQVSGSYYWESMNMIFSLGVNAPVGKRELTQEQFATSVLFSNSLFNLQVPVLGQGLNLNPGVTWVYPLTETVALGLAAAFQYRGPYKPREGLDSYDPGEEFTASTGVDFRVTETVSISADFVLTAYTADKFGDTKIFASGNAYWVNLQYKQYFREDELLGFLGYRTRSKGQIAGAAGLVDEAERLEPGRLEAFVQYRQVFNNRFSMGYIVEARIFETTPSAFAGAKVFGAGVAPVIGLGSGLSIPARAKFSFGKLKGGESIVGLDAGLGLTFTF